MKITNRIADLVIKLGRHEPYEDVAQLIVGDEIFLMNVLRMFHQTSNKKSLQLISQILIDSRYGLDEEESADISFDSANDVSNHDGAFLIEPSYCFSDAEFELLEVTSCYLH